MTNTFIQTIETDLQTAWGDLEAIVEKDASEAWAAIKSLWTSMLPAQWAILKGLVATVIADVEKGDLAALETAVLNQAGSELAWLTALGKGVLQAALASILTAL